MEVFSDEYKVEIARGHLCGPALTAFRRNRTKIKSLWDVREAVLRSVLIHSFGPFNVEILPAVGDLEKTWQKILSIVHDYSYLLDSRHKEGFEERGQKRILWKKQSLCCCSLLLITEMTKWNYK